MLGFAPPSAREMLAARDGPPSADTKVHRHPEAAAIIGILERYCVQPVHQRVSWSALGALLRLDFPGLDASADFLRWFCRTHVQPALTLSRASVVSALADQGFDLNTCRRQLEIADSLGAEFRRLTSSPNPRTGDGARIARLAKTLSTVLRNVEDSMERFGLIRSE